MFFYLEISNYINLRNACFKCLSYYFLSDIKLSPTRSLLYIVINKAHSIYIRRNLDNKGFVWPSSGNTWDEKLSCDLSFVIYVVLWLRSLIPCAPISQLITKKLWSPCFLLVSFYFQALIWLTDNIYEHEKVAINTICAKWKDTDRGDMNISIRERIHCWLHWLETVSQRNWAWSWMVRRG